MVDASGHSVGRSSEFQVESGTARLGAWFWLVPMPLALVVMAAFIPALDNGFVNWDDDKNFLDNPYYRGLGGAELTWAGRTFWLGVYQPLAWLLFEVQYFFWKLDPRGYHVTSVILHVINAVVLYVLTVNLLVRCRQDSCERVRWPTAIGAALVVALFAVHPLRVEAVAWASCQPYLPCALFSMLTILSHLRAFENSSRPRWCWLVAAFVLFVAALLSHAGAVGLPAVLLILDVYPLRRFAQGSGRWFAATARSIWYEKIPFVIVSLVFMSLAIAARSQSLVLTERNAPSASIAQACYGIWFYLLKTALPLNLNPAYPAPTKIDWLAPPFVVTIIATLAMSAVLFDVRRRWPGPLAAWLCYLVILAPNAGIIRVNDQIAADRYSYLSMVGLVIVVAGCYCRLWQTKDRPRTAAVGIIGLAVGLLLIQIPMTWSQCRIWRNSETLWTHALNHGAAESSLAHYNLALVLYRSGKLDAAAAHDAHALRIKPDDAAVHNNLGVILQRQGRLDAAAARYAEAVRIDPDYLEAHYNLGIVLSFQGKFAEAASQYAHALRLNPRFADAHNNLGVDQFRQGNFAEALAHYTEALRLNPSRVDTHTNLGVVLSRRGKLDEAAAHYAEALRLDPNYTEARKNLEIDIARKKQLDEAAVR